MKRLILFIGLSVMMSDSIFSSDNLWGMIKEKTWISITGGFINGEHIVFYESINGIKKAIKQLHGSGVYVIATYIYDVDILQDTLYLKKVVDDIITTNLKLIYKNKDSILVSSNDTLKYKIFLNEPLIYNWQGDLSHGEIIPIETLKNIPVQKGMNYNENIFINRKDKE